MTAGAPFSAGAVVVGGGVIGCSVAFHLRKGGFTDRIVVLERDASYRRASSRLAFGGIRQQYATQVNARMAQRSFAFYRRFDDEMAVGGRPAPGREGIFFSRIARTETASSGGSRRCARSA